MRPVQTAEDIYPAVEELIAELKLSPDRKLADILHHRMHQVAWTARSELFEELKNVLTEAVNPRSGSLPETVETQIRNMIEVIDTCLGQ